MIQANLPDDKTGTCTIAPQDAKGNAAAVDGVPTWRSTDENVLTVAAAADGLSAVVTPAGPLGTAQIIVDADADLGAGVTSLQETFELTVVAGQAVSLGGGFQVNP